MTSYDVPLPIDDAGWELRLKRSRQTLSGWEHELKLPWANREMTRTIAETEISALRHFVPFMPVGLRPRIPDLVHDWDELRLATLK